MSCEVVIGLRVRPDRRLEVVASMLREYERIACLSLTVAQASRLWSLDTGTCAELLSCLADGGYLRRRPDGMYVRGDSRLPVADDFYGQVDQAAIGA